MSEASGVPEALLAVGQPAVDQLKEQLRALTRERRAFESKSRNLTQLRAAVIRAAGERDERISPALQSQYTRAEQLREVVERDRRKVRSIRRRVERLDAAGLFEDEATRTLADAMERYLHEAERMLATIDEEPAR